MQLRITVVLAIVAVSLLVAACGGDGDEPGEDRAVAEVVTRYLKAVARGDGEAACSHLTENAQLGVFEFRFAHVGPDHPDRACTKVVEQSDLRGEAKLLAARVTEVEVDGDTARASIEGIEVKLERLGDEWKIDEFGVAGRLAGESPPPETTLH